jgi:hypothetical protein
MITMIKKSTIILGCFLVAFCANSLSHAYKRQTIIEFLTFVSKKEYDQVYDFFPLGLPRKSGKNYKDILDKINISLEKYGMPSKDVISFTRSEGRDASSSYTEAIVPLYKSTSKKDSLESIEVVFLFLDELGDSSLASFDININRRMMTPIKP